MTWYYILWQLRSFIMVQNLVSLSDEQCQHFREGCLDFFASIYARALGFRFQGVWNEQSIRVRYWGYFPPVTDLAKPENTCYYSWSAIQSVNMCYSLQIVIVALADFPILIIHPIKNSANTRVLWKLTYHDRAISCLATSR